jgi:hypothetical protein
MTPPSYILACYGGGLNSTAMLLRWVDELLPLSAVTFADTGGERPETYANVARMSAWLVMRGYPPVVTVRYATREGQVITLEERCLSTRRLPSLAYGFKKCSQKFKRQPQEKWAREQPEIVELWARGEKVTKLLGYDADEPHRADRARERYAADLRLPKPSPDVRRYTYEYPLIDRWNMGREECQEVCEQHGFCSVPKSACWFCPSSSNRDIYTLKDDHPDLLARALEIERTAESTTAGRGLGGQSRRWADIIAQPRLFTETERPISCDCYDGEAT